MKTYLFNFSVEPTNNTWWDSRKNETVKVKAENLKAANEAFFEVLEEKYGFDISKTAKKRPSKMYTEYKDGSSKRTGYIWKASTEIEWSHEKPWKKVFADIWTEINVLNNPFEA